ncbi:MAG: amidohydrolase family protein [Bacteroidetes bacterium]|jgi:imidazolonepropionase-like amidohydrolase|nr:amidohydrolase family protein [Bacteroidota bacterium]
MSGAAIALVFVAAVAPAQVAIKGAVVHTMAGAPITDGVVLVKDGKIERVGPASAVAIPAGYKIMIGAVVTPGLVDAHSTVGLSGILNITADQMQLEKSDAFQPELRAIDAYNPREALVKYVRDLGTTTLHTGHSPGALASGTTIVVKPVGGTVQEAMVAEGMVAFTLGPSVQGTYRNPGTSGKAIAMLRGEFIKAQDYAKKLGFKDPEKRPTRDLKMELLSRILSGEVRILYTANRATDILTVLRLQKEFGFELVLDGAAEAYLVLDELKAAGVPVVLHPTMARPGGDMKNLSVETASKLKAAGIPFALQTGHEGYVPKTRVLLYEAAVAAANGLSFNDALAAITIDAARIIGVDKRVGSLEAGKDADVVIFDGDPFEYTSHVCGVLVNGVVVSETCH